MVLYEKRDAVALLTLNRPDKLNALDCTTIDWLQKHFAAIEDDPSIRAVVLTGAGNRAFSAGADIAEFRDSVLINVDAASREFVRRGQRLTATIEAFPKPVVAAVNGLAFGGGCEILEATHLAVAVESATFAKPEIKLGIIPCFGGTQRLPRVAGRKRALEMILTGEPISAVRAREIGLINEIVDAASLLDAAFSMAEKATRYAPLAVKTACAAVTRGLNVSIAEGLEIEASQFALNVPTVDAREGIAAFLEKRTAHFTGR